MVVFVKKLTIVLYQDIGNSLRCGPLLFPRGFPTFLTIKSREDNNDNPGVDEEF